MKVKQREHLNGIFEYMPNGIIHIIIFLTLPMFIVLGVFKGGVPDALKEWWGELFCIYKYSEQYKRNFKKPLDNKG
jgi:hypothetical protein